MRRVLLGFVLISSGFCVGGQVFTGTIPPRGGTELAVPIGAGATNVSFIVPGNATLYSHILVRKDTPPQEADYAFSSQLDAQTNSIHLEMPEVSAGTWYVRLENPFADTKTYTLIVQTNQLDLRTAAKPVTKPINSSALGAITANAWEYFRFEVASPLSWTVSLQGTNRAVLDLYVNRGAIPTSTAYLKRCVNSTNDLLAFSTGESVAGAYYVGVAGVSGPTTKASYTLLFQPVALVNLAWDPGATHTGTEVYTNFTGQGGDFYFRVVTANPASGGWRTALRLYNTNEANLYVSRGSLPTPDTADFKSERAGSDGMVLSIPAQAIPNEEWFVLVRARSSAQWTLVSGAPFVKDLGLIADDDSSGSGDLEIGPEGYRFFTATVPSDLLAWRLWLYGATNQIVLKKTGVPLATPNLNEGIQRGQMLVVPPYLGAGSYFIGVQGTPHSIINLDSRRQTITDLSYGAFTLPSGLAGYGYNTYRVQVPPEQIAWQLYLTPDGDANIAVQKSTVPNENYNAALSELPGTNVDQITLVSPVLSDGTFYVTIYTTNISATNITQFTFREAPAVITDIPYSTAITNDDPNRVGWRFYRLTDRDRQLNSLGWDLFVTNFAPGTRIALRRNMAPGFWSFRNPYLTPANYYDSLSAADFLQSPDQQADVWYVGVYNPTNLLGKFVLTTRELQATPLADNSAATRANVLSGRWEFFRVTLTPEDVAGSGPLGPVLGWDIRLTDVSSGTPRLMVRRERLPAGGTSSFPTGGNSWPSGGTWAADKDWTKRSFSSDGLTNEDGRILAMGVGRPLEPSTYYIGVLNTNPTNSATYKVLSRWIGPSRSIPVYDLAFNGGKATNTIPAREAAYYRVMIPENTPSWKARLSPTTGEAMLVGTTNRPPTVDSEKRMQKTGKEQYVMLPSGATNLLTPGTNFLVVVSEGAAVTNNRIGAGSSTFVVESLGAMEDIGLGLLNGVDILRTGSLQGGESIAYNFQTHPGLLGFWIILEQTTGYPCAVSRAGLEMADPGLGGDTYGNEGGKVTGAIWSSSMITVADPGADERIMLKARPQAGAYVDATYTLRVKENLPEALEFNGGLATITNGSPLFDSFFRVVVPPDAKGWDIRLTNIISGSPELVIARDYLPITGTTIGFGGSVFSSTSWPSGARWAADDDWTGRWLSPDGVDESGTLICAGMGRPLEPGVYYVGVLSLGLEDVNCQVLSRGIGAGYNIPIQDLAFAGGTAVVHDQAPREAAYFRVQIPTNTASWKVRLAANNGESLLIVLKDTIPNVGAALATSITNSGGRKMQKLGDEEFLLLPYSGQNALYPGTYYLAVVSEGQATTNMVQIGAGTSSYTITSLGEAPVTYLGDLALGEIVHSNWLAGGETRLYQFSVPGGVQSLDLRLENRTGNPTMALGAGARAPDPGAALNLMPDPYGNEGGEPPGNYVNTNLVSVANPSNGVYTVAIKARSVTAAATMIPSATYTLHVSTSTTLPLPFDGGAITVANQPAGVWKYYRVEVPREAVGWDIRLTDVTAGLPRLVVRRQTLPSSLLTTPWTTPGKQTLWPTNSQWAPGQDWTKRSTSADGVSEEGRILAVGMNQPLEPGTYIVGVINSSGTAAMSYTVLSRGIGNGFAIPLLDLSLVGSVTNAALPPREAAYYRVVIPTNTASWKLNLSGVVGESMLAVLRASLPNFDTVAASGSVSAGKGMQKLGNENLLVLPPAGQTNITAGTNYLAVISEGINPASSMRIGNGSSSFVLTSMGAIEPLDLGLLTSEDLVYHDALQGGETKAYRFYVPPGMYGFRALLQDRAGNPALVLLTGDRLPDPGSAVAGAATDYYGNDGGASGGIGGSNIVTVANPVPGSFSLIVKARQGATIGSYPDATYTLRLQEILAPELNFSRDQNTTGVGNIVSGLLQDNERAFFRVVIPATNHGEPVIGWKLELTQSSGQALMRVRKDFLPSDEVTSGQIPFTAASAVIAPPFLTNGTWFVEVKGSGSTAFTLQSSALALERPAWQMPAPGEPTQTPGVLLPDFADTGVDTNGVALGADEGIFLELGKLHYYAVRVPESNIGLLRAQLIAINGNPDLYIRAGAVPTLHHNATGSSGTLYDRSMVAATFTEYANWVPLDGKVESLLKPGLYYMAVKATTANARYRLLLGMGQVIDLPIQGDGLTNQIVAGGDWLYYRVMMPKTLPLTFNVTFSQERGDVMLYLRDTVPPGNGATTGTTDIKDWKQDRKNFEPYLSYNDPGTYQLSAPPVRPGAMLYLGFQAAADSSFSVRVATNGAPVQEPKTVSFYGGSVETNVQPHSTAVFRVDVPPEATRWVHTSTHTTNIGVWIDQGTLPATNGNRWGSSGADSSYSTPLVRWDVVAKSYVPGTWPWVPGQSYYFLVTNRSDLEQSFALTMNGKNAVTEDMDADGMPDAWELYYWNNLFQTANGDNDGDGISNLNEYLEQTDPLDKGSYRPRLFTAAVNGTVERLPDLANYPLNGHVVLTGVPAEGYAFIGWAGDIGGLYNPVTLTMDSNKTVYAKFKLAGDDLITALPIYGTSETMYGTNVGFSKEPGEPMHAGNAGGKSIWWRWTAPSAGPVTLSTAGSTFTTLLAVYTGSVVSNLTLLASDINSTGGTNRSRVTFNAEAGTTYNIAVDGYNGASSKIVLSLRATAVSLPLVLGLPSTLEDGSVQFVLYGQANSDYQLEYSDDLATWTPLGSVTTWDDGTAVVIDFAASSSETRFYRASPL